MDGRVVLLTGLYNIETFYAHGDEPTELLHSFGNNAELETTRVSLSVVYCIQTRAQATQ